MRNLSLKIFNLPNILVYIKTALSFLVIFQIIFFYDFSKYSDLYFYFIYVITAFTLLFQSPFSRFIYDSEVINNEDLFLHHFYLFLLITFISLFSYFIYELLFLYLINILVNINFSLLERFYVSKKAISKSYICEIFLILITSVSIIFSSLMFYENINMIFYMRAFLGFSIFLFVFFKFFKYLNKFQFNAKIYRDLLISNVKFRLSSVLYHSLSPLIIANFLNGVGQSYLSIYTLATRFVKVIKELSLGPLYKNYEFIITNAKLISNSKKSIFISNGIKSISLNIILIFPCLLIANLTFFDKYVTDEVLIVCLIQIPWLFINLYVMSYAAILTKFKAYKFFFITNITYISFLYIILQIKYFAVFNIYTVVVAISIFDYILYKAFSNYANNRNITSSS